MTWTVQLVGDSTSLSTLAQSLTGTDVNISHDGQNYVLASDRFRDGDDANTIRQKSEAIVHILNGAARLALDARQSIRVSAAYRHRPDGRRDLYAFVEPLVSHFHIIAPTVRVSHSDGKTEDFHPADAVRAWMALAVSNDAVANVFRILASGTLDWVHLYHLLEIIAADVGGVHTIAANGWAKMNSIRLFKHTANSPGAVGMHARHGAPANQPPANPMTVAEARNLLNTIVYAWLRSK